MNHICYISIGSNLGNRMQNCSHAMSQLNHFATIINVSSFYETEPWGYNDKNYYINAVIKIHTDLMPHDLLNKLKAIEMSMGRKQKEVNTIYQARIIDLDILFFDNSTVDDVNLVIPHPKLIDRKYVLQPFAEIDPFFICPVNKMKIIEILNNCQDKNRVNLYTH